MTQASLAIRPWNFERHEQPTVAELLDRVNRERGHFRDIIDASLQEELAAEGALELSESEEEESDVEEAPVNSETTMRPTTREELYHAKFDMLQKVSLAHNEVMMALDFVSLLESKDSSAGKQSMSQYLKDNVPTGTLGTDVWQRLPRDIAREEQDTRLAYNVRMGALQKSADDILGAAKILEDNVRKETRYWDQILSVTHDGWNVCRLPGQRHKLGVRFGLNESGSEFNRGGIAALVAAEDGAVSLDRGIETKSRIVRLTVLRGDEVVGQSIPPQRTDGQEAAIAAHIKHARDALFDEELFREMEREARNTISAGVQTSTDAITFPFDNGSEQMSIHFELLRREEAFSTNLSGPEDFLAQGLLSTAKLLLCQAHRNRLRERSRIPAAMNDIKTERQSLQVLTPLLTTISHYKSMQMINAHLQRLSDLLHHAGVANELSKAQLSTTLPASVDSTEALVSILLSPKSSEASIHFEGPDNSGSQLIKVDLQTLPNAERQTVLTVHATGIPSLHVTKVKQALLKADELLASLLAKALASNGSEGWQIEEQGAHLFRPSTTGDAELVEVDVSIDSQAFSLSSNAAAFVKEWTLESKADRTLWQAWSDLT